MGPKRPSNRGQIWPTIAALQLVRPITRRGDRGYTASRFKVGIVLEWSRALSYYCRSFKIWRKIYTLRRLLGSPFKHPSK